MRLRQITFATLALTLAVLFVQPINVSAQYRSLTYNTYDVTIDVDRDSTVVVTEEMDIVLDGTWRGLQRGIPLENPNCTAARIRSGLNCGGFDTIQLLEVKVDDRVLSEGEYEHGVEELEEDAPDYFVVRYRIWPGDGQTVSSHKVKWSVKYKLYGSLSFASDDVLLYWNVLPADRGGIVKQSRIEVNFPTQHRTNSRNFNYYYTGAIKPVGLSFFRNQLSFDLNNLPILDNGVTIEYRITDSSVLKPAKIEVNQQFPWIPDLDIKLNGSPMQDLNSVPVGKHVIAYSYPGYQEQSFEVNAEEGGLIQLDVSLTPGLLMAVLLVADLALFVFGLVGIVWLPFRVYQKWRREGKDQQLPGAIVPQFTPPKGIKPYLAGSLRDEQVDPQDISGTIIDLAYRGYLKIFEDKKNYTLMRTDGSKPKANGDELDDIEAELIDALFGTSDKVEINGLNATFYVKSVKLQALIYSKMVELGYFAQSPFKTRQKYFGVASGYIVGGGFLLVISMTLLFFLLGVPGPFTLGIAFLFTGIIWSGVAKHMPAKTPAGSKAYYDVEGFKMYMYRAERYRLQELKPEEFERYLGYAVAFGIERQWAENFKDIYKGQPDWYEGSHVGFWDVYWTNRFLNSFTGSLNANAFRPVQSGSGVSGSGWSGGSSFGGGFSGGGGGGGFSGGF